MSQKDNDPAGSIVTVNLDRYANRTLERYRALLEVGGRFLGKESVRDLDGSGSFVVNNKTVAKVIPQDPGDFEYVLLGVSSDFDPASWSNMPGRFSGPYDVHDSLFHILPMPKDLKTAVANAEIVFNELKLRIQVG